MFEDFLAGLCLWRYWLAKAIINYRLVYIDSKLGLLWPNLAVALLVFVLGTVWGILLDMPDIGKYYLYLAAGYPVWLFLSSSVNQGVANIVGFSKGNGLPVSTFLFERLVTVSFRFLNIVPLIILALFLFGDGFSLSMLWFPVALLTIMLWSLGVLMILMSIVAIVADFKHLVNAVMGLAFLATPIIWDVSRLGEYQHYIWLNPFFSPLEFMRYSLTGNIYHQNVIVVAVAYSLLLSIVGMFFFTRNINKIKYSAS